MVAVDRRRFIGTTAMALAAIELGGISSAVQALGPASVQPGGSVLPPFKGATGWLNSPALTPAGLRGKVVLVNFCTYTCINWLRSLPYVRAWAKKYKNQALVVLGVHTPEFGFEKDVANVSRELKNLGITYPIALDNDYAIWRAFENQHWPALYFADARGQIRHQHFGEGKYEESEQVIQGLLREAGASSISPTPVAVEARGIEAAAEWASLKSPERYLGRERTGNFASPGGSASSQRQVYAIPQRLRLNEWALAGEWTMDAEAAVLKKANGRIATRFRARDLHLVMGPAARGKAVRFQVRLDGQAPSDAHGLDVDAQGSGTASEHRLYQLVRQQSTVVERLFEIEFLDPGLEAFAFTFG